LRRAVHDRRATGEVRVRTLDLAVVEWEHVVFRRLQLE
jgi:hypothetical protein